MRRKNDFDKDVYSIENIMDFIPVGYEKRVSWRKLKSTSDFSRQEVDAEILLLTKGNADVVFVTRDGEYFRPKDAKEVIEYAIQYPDLFNQFLNFWRYNRLRALK